MRFRLVEDSWQSLKSKIDKNKLNKLCGYILEENEPAENYMNFKYKDDYLLASTILDGYRRNPDTVKRNEQEEKGIRQRAKENGVHCTISVLQHRDRFDVIEGVEVRLRIPYELISKDQR